MLNFQLQNAIEQRLLWICFERTRMGTTLLSVMFICQIWMDSNSLSRSGWRWTCRLSVSSLLNDSLLRTLILLIESDLCNYTVMSADDSKQVVMKGVTHGACDYLIKPVRIEALKNIWQHVVRKRKNEWKDLEQSGSVEEGDRQPKPSEEADYSSSANEGNWRTSKRRKDEEEEMEERDDTSTLKKPRVVWSVELHQQFVSAVNHLGIDSKILWTLSFYLQMLVSFL